jgi:hypothetical protein
VKQSVEETSQRLQTNSLHEETAKKSSKLYQKFKSFRLQVFTAYLEIDWFLKAKTIVNRKYLHSRFDIVLSSFGPLGSHLIGRYIKKKKLARHWIADLRDNMQSEDYLNITNRFYAYFELDMIKKANAITVVSLGQYDMLQNSVGKKNFSKNHVHVIYNGYENKIDFKPNKIHSNVLKISYTGALYAGKRDMSLLFRAISELINEDKIQPNNIELHYAGTSSKDFLKQAHSFGISEIVHDYGYVSRDQSIQLQKSSDILVVLSWNTIREQGILSGKFLEYLQVLKPIISITCGDLEGAELTKMVNDMNLGIGCEYIRKENDFIKLKQYILSQYNRIISGNSLGYDPDVQKLEEFYYGKIVKKVEKICFELVNVVDQPV